MAKDDLDNTPRIRLPSVPTIKPSLPNLPKFDAFQPPKPSFDFDELAKTMARSRAVDRGFAEIMYERLMEEIYEYEKELNSDQEIAAYLSSFGTRVVMSIKNIGYHNPYFIIFYGTNIEDGQRVRLVQHVSQISVLFTAIRVAPEENREPRRIGFVNEASEVNDDQNSNDK